MEELSKNSIIFITKKIKKVKTWTKEEDEALLELAEKYGYKNWKAISENLEGRTPIQCSARYKRIRPGLTKGAWTVEEDKNVLDLIKKFGKNWSLLAKYMPSRSGKQIRDRFLNTLDPNINKDKFTAEEDKRLIQLYSKFGTSWSKLSNYFPGRTGDMIKNRFYSSLRKKIQTVDLKRIKRSKSSTNKSCDFDQNSYGNICVNVEFSICNNAENESVKQIISNDEIKIEMTDNQPHVKLLQESNDQPKINNNFVLPVSSKIELANSSDFIGKNFGLLANNKNLLDIENSFVIKEEKKTNSIPMNIDSIDSQMNNLLSNLVQNTQLNKINKKNDLESQLDILKKMLNYTYLKLDYFNKPQSNTHDSKIASKIYDLISFSNKNNC